jgi:DUF4097 and DUF4098 domain-containing protein YvlB
MYQKNLKILIIAIVTLIAGIFFTACQQSVQNPSGNITDRRQTDKTPVKEIFPTLQISHKNTSDANIPAATGEFQLRDQTSRYTNSSKSALEITLTDSRKGTCENENPELLEGESVIKITVKSKNGKALTTGDYTPDKYDLAMTITTKTGDKNNVTKFDPTQIQSFKVTDLNKSIFRGNFQVAGTDIGLEGEFFTAICK